MGADDENDFTQVYGAPVRLRARAERGDLRLARRPAPEPFRSGVNASFLRSPLRSDENVASMSQDGRFTVFLSAEDDLSADDDDRFVNVYRRDNLTGETILVSRADGPAGAAANGTSGTSGGGLVLGSAVPSRRAVDLRRRQPDRVRERRDQPRRATTRTALPDVFVRDVAAGTTDAREPRRRGCGHDRSRRAIPRSAATAAKVAFVTALRGRSDGRQQRPRRLPARPRRRRRRSSSAGRAPPGRPATTARARPRSTPTASHVAFATDADDFSALPTPTWPRTSGSATSAPGRSRW